MSDIKRTCPACDSWTSSVGIAFRDGEPCPYCGLPAEAVEALDRAAERGAEQSMVDMAAKAEVRATNAEAEVRRLRGLLREILWSAQLAEEEAPSE